MSSDTFEPTFDPAEHVSRYAHSEWGYPEDITTGREWLALSDRAGRQGTPGAGEPRTKSLFRLVCADDTAEYAIAERGVVHALPTIEAVPSPARFTKASKLRGARFLDPFFAAEPGGPWFTARDEHAFEALLEWATRTRPSQEALNVANHAVCLGVLARAGIVLHPSQLPGWPQ